jgi:predicted dehydrogenase
MLKRAWVMLMYANIITALRVGIIGSGCIGIEHMKNIALCPEVHVMAVADNHWPSRAAAVDCLQRCGAHNVVVTDDYKVLIALPTVDAIWVCTPNDHHIEVLRDALKSGKHCLVEKPLCTTIRDCAEAEVLAEIACAQARAAGRPVPVLWCGMEYRYIPSIARLLQEARMDMIGEVRMLSIREHRFPFLRKVANWNRFTDRTGGTLVEKCCHFFDLMRLIMADAEPVRIVASGGQDVNHLDEMHGGVQSDILDNAYVIVEFERGRRALLEICMFAEASKHQEEVSLIGDRGKLEAFAPSHSMTKDDPDLINFRRGTRSELLSKSWSSPDPPAPSDCGDLIECHEDVDAALLEAGNHCGATYHEVYLHA